MIAHILVALCMFLFVFLLRAFHQIVWKNGCLVREQNPRSHPVKVMIILGSGGHTTEILRIVAGMKSDHYSPRIYVKANTDTISAMKVKEMEGTASDFELFDIRRSREVHQPYLASVWTTIIAILDSIPLVWNNQPDLILCNGPGTCVPLCFVAFIYKLMFIMKIRIVFVESFCRVKTLSLTGKIMYYIADFVVVRWKHWNESLYHKTIYL